MCLHQELGLVITGTLPVFNKTKTKDDRRGEVQQKRNQIYEHIVSSAGPDPNALFCLTPPYSQHQNQLILGVMGIDVSLLDIKKLTPRFTVSSTLICDGISSVFLFRLFLQSN